MQTLLAGMSGAGTPPSVSGIWSSQRPGSPLSNGLDLLRAGKPKPGFDSLLILSAWELIQTALDGNTAVSFSEHIRPDEHLVTDLCQSNAGLDIYLYG